MLSLAPSSLSTLFNVNPTVHISPTKHHHSRPISSSHKPPPISISTAQNQSYWASIEAHLKKTLTIKDPISVHEPMHHFIFSSPRTTAPALCLAACDLLGGDDNSNQAISAAAAIHILHAAAYTHEHLPLSNRPSLSPRPKSKPMAHVYGPNIELLLGDGLVPFGLELVARSDNENKSGHALRVIIEITRAFGSEGLVNGQYSELLEYDDLIVSEKKEGVIHACGAACGAILGRGSEEEIKRLKSFGFYVGMIQAAKLYRSKRRVEEFRDLALKELEGFGDENKVRKISSFV